MRSTAKFGAATLTKRVKNVSGRLPRPAVWLCRQASASRPAAGRPAELAPTPWWWCLTRFPYRWNTPIRKRNYDRLLSGHDESVANEVSLGRVDGRWLRVVRCFAARRVSASGGKKIPKDRMRKVMSRRGAVRRVL